jgi:LysM repeat protein
MLDRSPARFVAPLALAGAVAAIVVVINHSHHKSSANGATTTTTTTPVKTRPRHRHTPRFYTIRAGDLLSTIAQKTGVSTKTLEELNPNLDPQLLQTGQRIKLRP